MRRAVIALVMCVAACSDGATSVTPTTSVSSRLPTTTPFATLPCSGDQAAPPANFTVYFDAIALPASDTYPNALQTSSSGPDPSTRLWAKTGLWYRPDVAFEIVVPDQSKGRLAVGWGGAPSSPNPGVVHVACPNAPRNWVVLAGGYWASQTMCATVIVRVGDKQQQAHIGLGLPCPGQGPPGGPSDT